MARLVRDQPAYSQWAMFGSVLVQRKAGLQQEIHHHRTGCAEPSGKHITEVGELQALVFDTVTEIERRVHEMDRYLRSTAFTSVFGSAGGGSNADADGIIGAADAVMEFYAAHLRPARRIRGVAAPLEFADGIEDTTHLVDRSLEGVDRFITDLVGTVDLPPTLALTSGGEPRFYQIPLNLHIYNALLARIVARLDRLQRRYFRAFRWSVLGRIGDRRLGTWLRWLGVGTLRRW